MSAMEERARKSEDELMKEKMQHLSLQQRCSSFTHEIDARNQQIKV